MIITPTVSAQINTPSTIQSTNLWMQELHIIANPQTGVITGKTLTTPYATLAGATVFATSNQVWNTSDCLAASVAIPSFLVALNAIEQAISDWASYLATANANLVAAQAALNAAQTATPVVQATVSAAQAVVNAAQQALDPANASNDSGKKKAINE